VTFALELTLNSQDPSLETETVQHPTAGQVDHAVSMLDQRVHTMVHVKGRDWWNLLVGGGAGHYVLTIENQMTGKRHDLINRGAPEGQTVHIVAGGQEAPYPASLVVGLDVALIAVRRFVIEGIPEPSLDWITEQSA
jgi:hypothetical protein